MIFLKNIFKNIKIGKNNYIEKNVKIHKNVIIGDNNKIYNGTILYPNTIIGNNNTILNNNIIGEHPINSNEIFENKIFKGVKIGNNNFFHISNKIYGGSSDITFIGDNNKILGENHIGHDCIINNYVNIYPRTLLCGYVKMLDYSGSGVGTYVHQHKVIGHFGFTSMNSSITKNSFPFFININNKYSKINYHRILTVNDLTNIKDYEKILIDINNKYILKNLSIDEYKEQLPENIYNILNDFLSYK